MYTLLTILDILGGYKLSYYNQKYYILNSSNMYIKN